MNPHEEHPALLRGHIFCAECGAHMIRNYFKRGKYEYLKYRCGSRWRPFATACRGEGVPLEAVHEWAWEAVKAIARDTDAIKQALSGIGPDPHLIADLEAVKREHGRTESALRALLSRSASDPSLWPHVEREVGRAAREKQQLEQIIAELEARVSEARERAAALRRLREGYQDLDRFTFDERRLTLRALGFKAYANGDEPALWRYEVSVPVRYGRVDEPGRRADAASVGVGTCRLMP